MNLVELNIDTIPLGQPLPFALRGVAGALLAQKGYVIRSHKELEILLARGQTLCVDTDESGESFRAFKAHLQEILLSDKPLGMISTITMSATLAQEDAADRERQTPHWPTWQARLTQLMRSPDVDSFLPRFENMHQNLARHSLDNPDAALLALVQMSAEETRHYCATHAMLVAAVCMITARETLRWPAERIHQLGRAGLSMNLGMGHLQDDLAQQISPLSPTQAQMVEEHAQRSETMLRGMGVEDEVWLLGVRGHHLRSPGRLADKTPANQVARLLQRADIFGARIAPRANRHPMSVTSAMQATYHDETKSVDEAGAAMVKALGIYPPGAWVKLASGETAVVVRRGSTAATPRVAVLVNKEGMPTGEPIPRDTAHPNWKIAAPVAHRDVRVRLPLDRLLDIAF
ncbi:HD-GYP domain-containing protein [Comamonas sp. GB3 AK4-5]|uniref:HD-GYP domain-containing protein n=1 Tax=Comamonas sp. GB3 AK4-5 TaxID=3231487 RepID=UPI00351DB06B